MCLRVAGSTTFDLLKLKENLKRLFTPWRAVWGSLQELVEVDGCLVFFCLFVVFFLRAIEALVSNNYKVIVTHVDHTGQANDSSAKMLGTAMNIYKKLTDYTFLLYFHLLWILQQKFQKFHWFLREMK